MYSNIDTVGSRQAFKSDPLIPGHPINSFRTMPCLSLTPYSSISSLRNLIHISLTCLSCRTSKPLSKFLTGSRQPDFAMAIQDDIPGLEVAVCIDGKPLEEYDNDEEEQASQAYHPKSFGIKQRVQSQNTSSQSRIKNLPFNSPLGLPLKWTTPVSWPEYMSMARRRILF